MTEENVKVLFSGNGEPIEPDWALVYTDEDDIDLARDQWNKVIGEMRSAQTLAVENGHAIRRLVDFRVIYERACRHVAEYGPILPPKRRNSKRPHGEWNPWWSVMKQSQDTIAGIEGELGIAPLKRGRAAKVQRKQMQARASDAYLSKKKA